MRRYIFILFLIFFFICNLFSQVANMTVSFVPLSNSDRDFEFQLNLLLPIAPSDGISIEFPQEISLIPVEITINGSSLWLQNLTTLSVEDSVIAWQTIPSGIMMIFKKGLFKSGDELKIRCISAITDQNFAQNQIRVKEIVSQTDGYIVAAEIFASGSIPQILNQ